MTIIGTKLVTTGNGQISPPGVAEDDVAAEVFEPEVLNPETLGDEAAAADTGRSEFIAAPEVHANSVNDDQVFPLELYYQNYKRRGLLGQGGQAIALLIERKMDGKLFVARTASSADGFKEVAKEVRALRNLDHPNIVKYHEIYLGKDVDGAAKIYLIMEHAEGFSLHQYLVGDRTFTEDALINIREEVQKGLDHAHGHNIVHRDIKPGNIMLKVDEDGTSHVKIIDFGVAKTGAATTGLSSLGVGTEYYMAPEQIFGGRTTPKTDMYALGLTLLALARGKERTDDIRSRDPLVELKDLRENGNRGRTYSKEFLDSIESMIQFEPARRGEPLTEIMSAHTLELADYRRKTSDVWLPVRELYEIERRPPNKEDILFLFDVCMGWRVSTYDLIPPEVGVTNPALWANWKANVIARLRAASNAHIMAEDTLAAAELQEDIFCGEVDAIVNIVESGWVSSATIQRAIEISEKEMSGEKFDIKITNIRDTIIGGGIALFGGAITSLAIDAVSSDNGPFLIFMGSCVLLLSVTKDMDYRKKQKRENPILEKYSKATKFIAEIKTRLSLPDLIGQSTSKKEG